MKISPETLNRRLREGVHTGGLLKRGPKAKYFTPEEYVHLKKAFVTMLALRQARNEPELEPSDLWSILGDLIVEK